MPFDPNKPFEEVKEPSGFDPSKPFEEVEEPSALQAGAGAFSRGVTLGFADEIGAGLEALGSKVGIRGLGGESLSDIRLETEEEDKEPFAEIYEKTLNERRAAKVAQEEAFPTLTTGAELGGALLTPVPGSAALRGASLGKKILGTAAQGAALSGIESIGRAEGDIEAGEVLEDAALGGAIGGAIPAAGAALKGMKKVFGETLKDILPEAPSAVEKTLEATYASPGKIRDIQFDKPDSIERMYDFVIKNNIQKGVATPKQQYSRVIAANKKIGKEIGDLYKEGGSIEKRELSKGLMDIANDLNAEEIFDEAASKKLKEIAANIQAKLPDGPVSAKKVFELRKMVDAKTRFNSDSAIQEANKEIRRVFREFEDVLLKDVGIADDLRRQFQAGKELEHLLEGAASRQMSRADITLKDLAAGAAGAAVDPVLGFGIPVINKLYQSYGKQTTAKALRKLESSKAQGLLRRIADAPKPKNPGAKLMKAAKAYAKTNNVPLKLLLDVANNIKEDENDN